MAKQWDLLALQSYINNEVEENIHLDYKAADALQKSDGKKKEIAKDVSAMANASGGIILYGMKESADPAKKYLVTAIDPVTRSAISKEWLEQVINTNIQPKIDGLIITPVTIDPLKDTVVYVVEIPQSQTAHQANDRRYYKRYNFESVAMEDYEIRDIMNRSRHPEMTLDFLLERVEKISPIVAGQHAPRNKWLEYRLKVRIVNIGQVYAKYVNYYLSLPANIIHPTLKLPPSDKSDYHVEYYGENTFRDITDAKVIHSSFNSGVKYQYSYGPSRFDPILPGLKSRYDKINLSDDISLNKGELHWRLHADNAVVQTGSISLSDIKVITLAGWEEF